MSVSALPWTFTTLTIVAALGLIGVSVGIVCKRRRVVWACVFAFCCAGFGAFIALSRLQRIHAELLDGDASIKTSSDLLSRYGSPTRKKLLSHDGRTIDAWIYEVTFFSPPVLRQFEMVDGKIWASVSTTHL